MNHRNEPAQRDLDAHYGYIYNIRGPGNRVYVGKHEHVTGEPWAFYTGSGLRLRNEQAWFEPSAFVDPKVRIEHLTRKVGTSLRYYRKYLTTYATDAADLAAKEARSIQALVESGTPFYNMQDAATFATSYDARCAMLAFRLSFEPKELASLPAVFASLLQAHHPLSFGGLDLPLVALDEAKRIASQRSAFRRRPQAGLTF
ncbi:hypothetical protein BFL35_14845 [Clavibacter michiganensis]|nr:hypothetical protein BFL35_14845 [Clavibacter michiganensis]